MYFLRIHVPVTGMEEGEEFVPLPVALGASAEHVHATPLFFDSLSAGWVLASGFMYSGSIGCLPSNESTDMALAGDDASRGKSAIARARQLNRGDDLAGAGLLAVIRGCRGSILICGGEGGGTFQD